MVWPVTLEDRPVSPFHVEIGDVLDELEPFALVVHAVAASVGELWVSDHEHTRRWCSPRPRAAPTVDSEA